MTDPTVPPGAYHINLAGRLGEIGALIMANRLPMPKPNRPPSLNFDLGAEVAKVEQVAAALGVEVHQYGPRVQASWPPIHERGDGLPFATWVAHIPADRAGFEFSREMAPEDGELTQPGRVEPHTGGVTDGGLVDETGGRACTCPPGPEDAHFPDCPKYVPPTDPDDLPCQPASGLTRAADQSRGPLAGTTPVVTYFSFGHGQTDPGTGKRLLNHYVTVVAPTYEACREAMFASRFGRAWSFDYLAGTARATEWIPLWTEHEVIVAPGTDLALADRALGEALKVLSAQVCADEEPF